MGSGLHLKHQWNFFAKKAIVSLFVEKHFSSLATTQNNLELFSKLYPSHWTRSQSLTTDSLTHKGILMAKAIRLNNGCYRFGNRVMSYRRVQLTAWRRGFRFLAIVTESGSMVDYIDLA